MNTADLVTSGYFGHDSGDRRMGNIAQARGCGGTIEMSKRQPRYEYDVCLSFAGEDRLIVRRVARELVGRGWRVFYDDDEQAKLWGKDLYSYLEHIYSNAARYCIPFLSKHYARKRWTTHERRAAQERAFRQNREYILPVRLDSTRVPGIMRTTGFMGLRGFEWVSP